MASVLSVKYSSSLFASPLKSLRCGIAVLILLALLEQTEANANQEWSPYSPDPVARPRGLSVNKNTGQHSFVTNDIEENNFDPDEPSHHEQETHIHPKPSFVAPIPPPPLPTVVLPAGAGTVNVKSTSFLNPFGGAAWTRAGDLLFGLGVLAVLLIFKSFFLSWIATGINSTKSVRDIQNRQSIFPFMDPDASLNLGMSVLKAISDFNSKMKQHYKS